jgi:hypothetical protein
MGHACGGFAFPGRLRLPREASPFAIGPGKVLMFRRFFVGVIFTGGVVAAGSSPTFAAVSADNVVSYTPGAVAQTYQNPQAALGGLSPTMNFSGSFVDSNGNTQSFTDNTILTPFNAAYNPDQIVGIGAGGQLTLHLSGAVATTGKTLGVHTGTGLIDASPNFSGAGQNLPTASSYTDPRVSTVRVSFDGNRWVSLGSINFQIPSNYYDQGVTNPGFTTTPGTHVADLSQPFTAPLTDFDNRDWPGTLTLLNGSAGGDWLDLSSTGLPGVNFVQFIVPAGAPDLMYVDAVAGVAIPEPASASLLLLSLPMLLRRSRRT